MTFEIAQVGEDILKTKATQVLDFASIELNDFIDKLLASMITEKGIGIAATQVFDNRAIMIVASKQNERYPDAPNMEPLVMINPKLLSHSKTMVKGWEGCLSVPSMRGLVARYQEIEFEYQDRVGEKHQLHWTGFLARIFQHEFDHLQGKTWLDRIESMEDVLAETVYIKKSLAGEL